MKVYSIITKLTFIRAAINEITALLSTNQIAVIFVMYVIHHFIDRHSCHENTFKRIQSRLVTCTYIHLNIFSFLRARSKDIWCIHFSSTNTEKTTCGVPNTSWQNTVPQHGINNRTLTITSPAKECNFHVVSTEHFCDSRNLTKVVLDLKILYFTVQKMYYKMSTICTRKVIQNYEFLSRYL